MRVASLFTGAGGLDLGLHQVGLQDVAPCAADRCNMQLSKAMSVPKLTRACRPVMRSFCSVR